ncbi:hypothetical protein IQ288_31610 [Burkholderia sp. R-69980]|nr:hypothetical protein [Burkholderia sp. R-69980]
MTTQPVLRGLLASARGVRPRVRPALGPRFAPARAQAPALRADMPPDDASGDTMPGTAADALSHESADELEIPATKDHPRGDQAATGTHEQFRHDAHTVRVDAVHDAEGGRAPAIAHGPRVPERPTSRREEESPLADGAQSVTITVPTSPTPAFTRARPGSTHTRSDRDTVATSLRGEVATGLEAVAQPLITMPTPPARNTSADDMPLVSQAARPVARPLHQPASQALSSPAPSLAPPSVQVTIGRVEVRAAPTPASAARPPAPMRPTVSLQAYLRRSQGGDS